MTGYISKPKICPVCAGIGWLKADGDSHPICLSCWGGGAIIVPRRKNYDKLIADIRENE